MHQFVTKILREDHRSSYDYYNGVILEVKPKERGSGTTAAEGLFMGCLLIIRCRLTPQGKGEEEAHAAAVTTTAAKAACTQVGAKELTQRPGASRAAPLVKFDLDKDEPAFRPPSLNASFSSAAAAALTPTVSSVEAPTHTRPTQAPTPVLKVSAEGRRAPSAFVDPLASHSPVAGLPQPVSRTDGAPSISAGTPMATAAVAVTEDFIVWASHTFLTANLPLVMHRIESSGGCSTSPTKSVSGAQSLGSPDQLNRTASSHVFGYEPAPVSRANTSSTNMSANGSVTSSGVAGAPSLTTLPLSYLSPTDDNAVICFRAADVLSAMVNTHHVTARDRRIHVVSLDVRDFGTASSSSATAAALLTRVVRHRFIFQSGGMTRFLSALKTMAPSLTSVSAVDLHTEDGGSGGGVGGVASQSVTVEDARSLSTASGRGPLEGSFGFRPGSPSSSSGPASPLQAAGSQPNEAQGYGKGWRSRLSASFFGLRRSHAAAKNSGAGGDGGGGGRHGGRGEEMAGWGAATQMPPPQAAATAAARGGSATSSSGREEETKESKSSESSFLDLTELEGGRSMIPMLHVPDSGSHAHLGSRSPAAAGGGGGDSGGGASVSAAVRWPTAKGAAEFSPLTEEAWRACFDGAEEVINYKKFERAREAVYRSGIATSSARIRFEVWMYLLDIFPPNSTKADREYLLTANKTLYDTLTRQWTSMLPEQVANFRAFKDRKHAIEKDVARTDRTLAVYKEDDSPLLNALQRVLMAHVQYNFDAGYSQGMSDVASVAVVLVHLGPKIVTDWAAKTAERERLGAPAADVGKARYGNTHGGEEDSELSSSPSTPRSQGSSSARARKPLTFEEQLDESAAFLCFRAILRKHMSQNFSMDPLRGMPMLLRQVQVLVRHFVPDVFAHLKKCMADDMTFCFRWLLMCLKREFTSMEDSMRLWDTIFGCPFTLHFEVIVVVALLVRTGTQIMANLHSCDAVLKFANNLSGNVQVEDVLRCAVGFYDEAVAPEVARMESVLQGAYVPRRQPTVEETVKLCVMVDGDLSAG